MAIPAGPREEEQHLGDPEAFGLAAYQDTPIAACDLASSYQDTAGHKTAPSSSPVCHLHKQVRILEGLARVRIEAPGRVVVPAASGFALSCSQLELPPVSDFVPWLVGQVAADVGGGGDAAAAVTGPLDLVLGHQSMSVRRAAEQPEPGSAVVLVFVVDVAAVQKAGSS